MSKLLHTTKVFAKAGLDNVTSAICKDQQQFGLDVQCSALVLNLNKIFSSEHLYQAGQSMDSLPSQILERCTQLTCTTYGKSELRHPLINTS